MFVETILAAKGSEVATAISTKTVSQAVTRMEANGIGDVVKVRLGEIAEEASALRAYIAGT